MTVRNKLLYTLIQEFYSLEVQMKSFGQVFGGNWTEQKLNCVSKYLNAYTKIMNNQDFNFAYVDAFAGTGYRKLKLEENPNETLFPELISQDILKFRQGSARNALKVKPRFQKYIFIEQDDHNFSELQKLRDEFLGKEDFLQDDIVCFQSDANEYLKDFCNEMKQMDRALVFLDPFGMQVEWNTIESITNTQAIDLWLLFPIGTVNRLLKRNGDIRPSIQEKLNLFFGDDTWYDVFYNIAQQIPMLGEQDQWEKVGDIFLEIEKYFVKRLKEIFCGVAENPLPLRNSKNVPLYLLCFAAGNPKGAKTAVKIAQDILLKELCQNT